MTNERRNSILRVLTRRHQDGISALEEETVGGFEKCRLFSQASCKADNPYPNPKKIIKTNKETSIIIPRRDGQADRSPKMKNRPIFTHELLV